MITSEYLAVLVLFAIAGLVAKRARTNEPEDNARPNIVLIVAVDVGYSDFGCYGGEIQTQAKQTALTQIR